MVDKLIVWHHNRIIMTVSYIDYILRNLIQARTTTILTAITILVLILHYVEHSKNLPWYLCNNDDSDVHLVDFYDSLYKTHPFFQFRPEMPCINLSLIQYRDQPDWNIYILNFYFFILCKLTNLLIGKWSTVVKSRLIGERKIGIKTMTYNQSRLWHFTLSITQISMHAKLVKIISWELLAIKPQRASTK